jgi:MoxR-like ATPase
MMTETTTGKKNGDGARRKRSGATVDLDRARDRLRAAVAQLNDAFVDRDDAVEMIALGLLSRYNYLFVGVHGTAKTALIRCFLSHVDGARVFARQCGAFSTVDDLFGPVDIAAYQKGCWARKTKGFLAESEYPFLDEVMKLSDGAFNMLLTVLNEREFDGAPVPMRSLGAATNWPEVKARTEKVEAGYDRFALRLSIERITDVEKRTMVLAAAAKVEDYEPAASISLAELDAAHAAVRDVKLGDVARRKIADLCLRLHKEGVDISERRSNQALTILAAHAWLRGSDEVGLEDFGALRFVFWVDEPDIEVLDSILDSLDQATVKRCVEVIDTARRRYESLRNSKKEIRLREAPAVIKAMRSAAKTVHEIIAAEGITEKGKATIRTEMAKIRSEVAALHSELRQELGLDEEAD